MPKRLTDEERAQRKKDSWAKLFASYKTYDDGKRGSADQWKQVAQYTTSSHDANLQLLNLTSMPNSIDELKTAWKKIISVQHPDLGGDTANATKINDAYSQLKNYLQLNTPATQIDVIEPARAIHIKHIDFNNLWIDTFYINDNYIAENKEDGSRYMLYLDEHPKLLSRHISAVTGKFVDKTLHCPHLTQVKVPREYWGTILDGELVNPNVQKSDATVSIIGCTPDEAVNRQKTSGWLKYKVWDMPKYCGTDIRNQSLRIRKQKLEELAGKIDVPIIVQPHVSAVHAKKYYETIISNGGEGIVLKDLNATYGNGWFKVKKYVTYDVVILGYKAPNKTSTKSDGTKSVTAYYQKGLIGSIRFGLYKGGKLVELGTCSGMDLQTRELITNNQQSYIGQVIEIRCQERTKSGAFRSARFIKIRQDKSAVQCIDELF